MATSSESGDGTGGGGAGSGPLEVGVRISGVVGCGDGTTGADGSGGDEGATGRTGGSGAGVGGWTGVDTAFLRWPNSLASHRNTQGPVCGVAGIRARIPQVGHGLQQRRRLYWLTFTYAAANDQTTARRSTRVRMPQQWQPLATDHESSPVLQLIDARQQGLVLCLQRIAHQLQHNVIAVTNPRAC